MRVDCQEAVAAILADAQRIVGCVPSGRRGVWLVTTTSAYSDHDLVQVTVEEAGGQAVRVTDGGLTVMRLEVNGAPWSGRARRDRMVTITRSFGVDLDEYFVIGATVPADELAGAVRRVASAAVQIDSLIHEDPVTRGRSFADDVSRWLRDRTTRTIVPEATVPGTHYVAMRVETVVPVFIKPVSGSTPTDRRRQAITATWEYEDADLRPEQAVVMLKGGRPDFRAGDIDRMLRHATLATWQDRMALSAHLDGADREGWSPETRLLTNVQLTT
jgi:hypothetical protein